jgi:SAM-dependent methyltransferase
MADQGSEGLLSPFLRRQRFKAVMPYLCGRVLDVGCGSGSLAMFVNQSQYVGVEVDEHSLSKAKSAFPTYRFQSGLPEETEKFDTIVSLAVIEHVSDAGEFLSMLAVRLNNDKNARIVCTTPHPSVDWVLDIGASLGFFSKHANEEHEDLLDKTKLALAAAKVGIVMIGHRRFLFGANQLAVFQLKGAE